MKETKNKNLSNGNYYCFWGKYKFSTFPEYTKFKDVSGVYIFSRLIGNHFYPLFAGRTKNLGKEIEDKKLESMSLSKYSNFVHVKVVDDKDKEQKILKKVVSLYNPPMNTKFRSGPANGFLLHFVKDRYKEF